MQSNNPEDKKKGIGLTPNNLTSKSVVGTSWFLGIGINKYQHFPTLNNAVKDVQDLATLLKMRYGFDSAQMITLFDEQATRQNIILALDSLEIDIQPHDKLLIYYSGHGHLKKIGDIEKGYWIPIDAERKTSVEYISNNTIRDYLQTIDSLHTLLLSDACFSGALFQAKGSGDDLMALKELGSRKSRWAICSGRHDEKVYDGRPGQNSPFAESVLYELGNNQSTSYNVSKLADQVTKMTRANYEQLPIGSALYGVGHKGGEYIFHLSVVEDDFWQKCRLTNTIISYSEYLEQFPNGQYASVALSSISILEEAVEWEQAQHKDRISIYYTFLHNFPKSKYAEIATARIKQLEQKTIQPNNPTHKKIVNWIIARWPWLVVLLVLLTIVLIMINANRKYDEFQFDGEVYRTIKLNGQTWLADNLNIYVENSHCNGDNTSCTIYGRLYTWKAAQEACFKLGEGWRLPSDEEWRFLTEIFGGTDANTEVFSALAKGGKSGLEILFGGSMDEDGNSTRLGDDGIYWSNKAVDKDIAISYNFYSQEQEYYRVANSSKLDAYSCRCIK